MRLFEVLDHVSIEHEFMQTYVYTISNDNFTQISALDCDTYWPEFWHLILILNLFVNDNHVPAIIL